MRCDTCKHGFIYTDASMKITNVWCDIRKCRLYENPAFCDDYEKSVLRANRDRVEFDDGDDNCCEMLDRIEKWHYAAMTLKRIQSCGSCSDCGRVKDCEYVPGWGELVRYNCPFYICDKEYKKDAALDIKE